jgi:hypothetical protein
MATKTPARQIPNRPPMTPAVRAAASKRRRERLESLAPTRCPDVMTLEEAMMISKLGEHSIRVAIDLGQLRARNLGGSAGFRITRRALYDWLEGIGGHHLAEFPLLGSEDPLVDAAGRKQSLDRVLATKRGQELGRELVGLVREDAETTRALNPAHPDTSEQPDTGPDAPLLDRTLAHLLDDEGLDEDDLESGG